MILAPKNTWARRNRRPMIRQLRNVALISLGVALVATSKSLGVLATSRSRTQPPTRYALWPARVSLRTTRSASGSIAARSSEGIFARLPYHVVSIAGKYANPSGKSSRLRSVARGSARAQGELAPRIVDRGRVGLERQLAFSDHRLVPLGDHHQRVGPGHRHRLMVVAK